MAKFWNQVVKRIDSLLQFCCHMETFHLRSCAGRSNMGMKRCVFPLQPQYGLTWGEESENGKNAFLEQWDSVSSTYHNRPYVA